MTLTYTTKPSYSASDTSPTNADWIKQCFTSRQHSIGYMGDGFYRSKYTTNSIIKY